MSYLSTSPAGGSGSGTVTQINTGTGLTGGPITDTGTIELSTPLAPLATLTGNALKVLRVNAGETAVEYATLAFGDVVGPASAVDGQAAVYDGTTGKIIKVFAPTAGSILFAGVNGILEQDNANFFYDNTNNRVIVGGNATDYTTYSNSINTIKTGIAFNIATGYGTSSGGNFMGLRANGTPGSATAVTSGNNLGNFSAGGYNGTSWSQSVTGIRFQSSENWSSTALGTQAVIAVVPNTTTTSVDSFFFYNNGQLGILVGAAATPAYTFSTDTNTGMYQDGADILAFAVGGSRAFRLEGGLIARFYGNAQSNTTGGFYMVAGDGTASLPTYGFNDDLNTGMWSSAGDTLDFSTGGTNRLSLSTTAFTSTVPFSVGTSNAITAGTIELGNASDTTLSRSAAGQLAVEGVDVITTSNTKTMTNKTLTSPVLTTPVVNGATLNGDLQIDGTPNTDDTWNGKSTNTFNAGATVAQFESVYLNSSGNWVLTDADAEATAGSVMVALAGEAGTNGNPMRVILNNTFVRNDAWNWTIGGKLFLSTTAGELTQTAPSGADDVVRVVGTAVSADVIYWNVSEDWIVHV